VRNIFDQYSEPENKLTHALMVSLDSDRRLLTRFVRWITGKNVGRQKLQVREQSLPGDVGDLSEEEIQRRGLPDGCVTDGDSWGLLIESKFAAKPSADQLQRHLLTARRRGIEDVSLLLITVHAGPSRLPDKVIVRQWHQVYEWLCKQAVRSPWARRCIEYMQVAETKETEAGYLQEGRLTVFSGIPFGRDEPYNYGQAKRLLKLLREELCQDKRLIERLGADLAAPGRSAITGRDQSSVWDFIPIAHAHRAKNHTQYLHLTLSIRERCVAAYVTIPNGIKPGLRSKVLGSNLEEFESLIRSVTTDMVRSLKGVKGFVSEVVVVQRHFLSQRSPGVVDCELKFDGRTALPETSPYRGRVKSQPQWVKAAHDALAHRQSNLEFRVGCLFPYDSCPTTSDKKIVRAISDVWLACAPIVQRAKE
jgi:hypothetical protein